MQRHHSRISPPLRSSYPHSARIRCACWGVCIFTVLALTGCSFYPQNKSVGIPFCAAGEGEIYELAVYRIADGERQQLLEARRNLRSTLGRYPGFRCALPLSAIEDPALGADLIVWRSIDDARAAQSKLPNDVQIRPLYGANRQTTVAGFFGEVPKAQ